MDFYCKHIQVIISLSIPLDDILDLDLVETHTEKLVEQSSSLSNARDHDTLSVGITKQSEQTFSTPILFVGSNDTVSYIKDDSNSWETNIYQETSTVSLGTVETGNSFSFDTSPTWTTTPSQTDITYNIVANGAEAIPSWISFNAGTAKYEGTAPTILYNETYSFVMNSSWSSAPVGDSQQIIQISVNVNVVCGDGSKHPSESWEDENLIDGDGWSSTWTIESGYSWDGGSSSSKDSCTQCSNGESPNSNLTLWQINWGDGLKHSTEEWDDNNLVDGDGCSSSWTIEPNFIWIGGSTSSKDTCSEWSPASSPNSNNDTCVTECGDGLKHPSEAWDDNNTNDSDGCTSTWIIESGYTWTGGTTSSPDTWSECSNGESLNTTSSAWEVIWGDGLKHSSEEWDDGNLIDGDGWDSSWTIETMHVWSGGTVLNKDSCEEWVDGKSPNFGKSSWEVIWGDGLKHSTEQCEDSNLNSGEGCSSIWTIESNYIWHGGTTSSPDTCSEWPPATYPNSQKDSWAPEWGDGLRHSSEEWDDSNNSNFDGCNSVWAIESMFIWNGGTTSTQDSWSECTDGESTNASKTAWEIRWGDGVKHLTEEWDDGNLSDADGWDSSWLVEDGYSCSSLTNIWREWTPATFQNFDKTSWIPSFGDGLKYVSEQWDDGNLLDGDGWSMLGIIEDNYVCSGGSESQADSCILWSKNTKPNENKTECINSDEMSAAAKAAVTSAQIAALAGIFMSGAGSTASGGSLSKLFLVVNLLQIIMILFIIDPFIPESGKKYLESQSFTLCNFNFIPTVSFPVIRPSIKWIDSEQVNDILKVIGHESNSAIVNSTSFLFVIFWVSLIHVFFKLVLWCQGFKGRNKYLTSFRTKVIDVIAYSLYLRLFLESHQSIFLTSAFEMKSLSFDDLAHRVSFGFAIILTVTSIGLPTLGFYYFWKKREEFNPKSKFFFMEFFEGIKNMKYARLYMPLRLVRTLLLIIIVLFSNSLSRIATYIIIFGKVKLLFIFFNFLLLVIQLMYLTFLIVLRPFEQKSDWIIEILNEIFLAFIIILMFLLNNATKWINYEVGFLYTMTMNSSIVTLIVSSMFFPK